jgi:hypothetical protein
MTRVAIAVAAVAVAAVAVLLASCDSFFFLRGTLGGDCDPPPVVTSDLGAASALLRKSNCQPPGSVCCRRSTQATRTSCQYPEDCYVAPFQGPCATAVDCADTQTCDNGSCQCRLGGPPCTSPITHVVTCCAAGQVCDPVMGQCANSSTPDAGA